MKKLSLLAVASIAVCHSALATVYFSDNFDSYANGNLVGQGPWLQTGSVATTPVQANNGAVAVGNTGQDIYAPLISPTTINDGASLYIGLDLSVSAAQSTGDYFLHWTPTVGNSSVFQERIWAKSSGAGYVLGYTTTAGTAVYGSTVLTLGTDYRLVLNYTGVAGPANDTLAIYVNPSDTTTEANNTAYLSGGFVGTGSETNAVAGINLRQGSAANAPTETVDNLNVATTFGEAAVFTVPEPSSIALGIAGGLAGLVIWKRRK